MIGDGSPEVSGICENSELVRFRHSSTRDDGSSTHRSFDENTFLDPDPDEDCDEEAAMLTACFDFPGDALVEVEADGGGAEGVVTAETLLETFVDALCIERLKAAIAAALFADAGLGAFAEDEEAGSTLIGFFPKAASDAEGVVTHECVVG